MSRVRPSLGERSGRLRLRSPLKLQRLIGISGLVVAMAMGLPGQENALDLSIGDVDVVVSNISVGESVALVAVGRGNSRGVITQFRRAVLLPDSDGDGEISIEENGEVPLRSVWIAAEIGSGRFAIAAPSGYSFAQRPLTPSLKSDVSGQLVSLEQDLPRLVVLVVRPEKGAWLLEAREGGSNDRDGIANGRLDLAFEDTTAIDGKEKGPKHLKKGDIVVAIDPGHLDVFVAEVEK